MCLISKGNSAIDQVLPFHHSFHFTYFTISAQCLVIICSQINTQLRCKAISDSGAYTRHQCQTGRAFIIISSSRYDYTFVFISIKRVPGPDCLVIIRIADVHKT
ncbi:hypothetical protein D9M68_970270 [compost metagenome]